MDNIPQNKALSQDTVNEIIDDLFCFDFLLELKRRMKNEEAKAYIGNFLRILAPIYIHEIANALDKSGLIAKNKLFSPTYKKRINQERQLSAHKNIIASTEAQKAVAEMGIDFSRKVYDIIIVVSNGELYDLNFESQVAPLRDLDFWNYLFLFPRTILETAFSAISPGSDLESIYNNNSSQLDSIARQLDDALSFSCYSYSTYKLFQNSNSLEQSDKILILYRYRMITSLNMISAIIPSLYATIGSKRVIDIEFFFRKYRALLICVLGDELCAMDTPFARQIKAELEANITAPNFFQLNRRLRNNLHYKETDVLTEEEMDVVLKNQRLYLSIIEKHFKHSINIDIDKECKTMTGFQRILSAQEFLFFVSVNQFLKYCLGRVYGFFRITKFVSHTPLRSTCCSLRTV